MNSPLNDIKSFASVCLGAGVAFILSAIFTLDSMTGISGGLFKLGIGVLIIGILAHIAAKKYK